MSVTGNFFEKLSETYSRRDFAAAKLYLNYFHSTFIVAVKQLTVVCFDCLSAKSHPGDLLCCTYCEL